MSILTALIVKNSHIMPGIYLIFLSRRLRPSLKSFQYQICISVKKSGKYLSSKSNFSTFLQISCSNF